MLGNRAHDEVCVMPHGDTTTKKAPRAMKSDKNSGPTLVLAYSSAAEFRDPAFVPSYMALSPGDPSAGKVVELGRLQIEEHFGVYDRRVSGKGRISVKIGPLCHNTHYILAHEVTNPTYLNGWKLKAKVPALLWDGDVLRIGGTLLVYRRAFELSPPLDRADWDLAGPWGLRGAYREFERIPTTSKRPLRVLVRGATGTGKEDVAQAVAKRMRPAQPFRSVNIAQLCTDGQFESEMFGVEDGVAPGVKRRTGLATTCSKGTMFLDEIGAMPENEQASLLRFVDKGEFTTVGGEDKRVDVAIVAATNEPEKLRPDLRRRFTMQVSLPPLVERVEDIFWILRAVAQKGDTKLTPEHVEIPALERLLVVEHTANVRGLMAVVEACDVRDGSKLLTLERVNSVLGNCEMHGVERAHEKREDGDGERAEENGEDGATVIRPRSAGDRPTRVPGGRTAEWIEAQKKRSESEFQAAFAGAWAPGAPTRRSVSNILKRLKEVQERP